MEPTPGAFDSPQSSSSQYSKHSTGDDNEEEGEEETQRDESRKRGRSDKNRNSNREMSSLRTTGGFPPYTSIVGGRRGKS